MAVSANCSRESVTVSGKPSIIIPRKKYAAGGRFRRSAKSRCIASRPYCTSCFRSSVIQMELPGKMFGRRPGLLDDFLEILLQGHLFFAGVEIILQDHRELFGRYLVTLSWSLPFPRAFGDAEHHDSLVDNAEPDSMDHQATAEADLRARLRILNADLEPVRKLRQKVLDAHPFAGHLLDRGHDIPRHLDIITRRGAAGDAADDLLFRVEHGVHEGEEVFLPRQDLGRPSHFPSRLSRCFPSWML